MPSTDTHLLPNSQTQSVQDLNIPQAQINTNSVSAAKRCPMCIHKLIKDLCKKCHLSHRRFKRQQRTPKPKTITGPCPNCQNLSIRKYCKPCRRSYNNMKTRESRENAKRLPFQKTPTKKTLQNVTSLVKAAIPKGYTPRRTAKVIDNVIKTSPLIRKNLNLQYEDDHELSGNSKNTINTQKTGF